LNRPVFSDAVATGQACDGNGRFGFSGGERFAAGNIGRWIKNYKQARIQISNTAANADKKSRFART